MNMVITDDGKQFSLAMLAAGIVSVGPTLQFGLYSNNYVPVDGSLPANFTPAVFTGYAPILLDLSTGWAVTLDGAAHIAYLTKTVPLSFTCTAGVAETIYGWFIYNADDNTIWCAQKFDSPRSMGPGATETIDPTRFALKTFA